MKSAFAAATLAGLFLSLSLPAFAQDSIAPGCMTRDAVPAAVLDAPFLVFGEVHGTREVPAFVAGYLCAATKAGRKLTLALEYPSNEQSALDAFMAGRGVAEDTARLTAAGIWRSPMQDGRSSTSMLGMYEAIRALRAGGADIRVVAIDGDVPTARRDAVMAERLRGELRQGAGRQLVALIGGLHAIRSKGKRFDPNYESAIYLVADQKPLALTVGTAGGTAWVCRGGTPASCNATAWDINKVTPPPSTAFSLIPPSNQFDGVFYVGTTTASPPAVGTGTAGR